MAKKKVQTVKRYGTRYGGRNREKLLSVEKQYKQLQKCPQCTNEKVKRLSAGIYICLKCGAKMSGRAYTLESSVKQGAE